MKDLVIENQDGKVVRYLKPNSENFVLVQHQNTRRLEAVREFRSHAAQNSYTVIQNVRTSDLEKHHIELPNGCRLRLVHESEEITYSPLLTEDSPDTIKTTLAVGIASLLLLFVVFLISNLSGQSFTQDQIQTVQIFPRSLRPEKIVDEISKERTSAAKREGASTILGALQSKELSGGLDISSIHSSRGPGLGGTAGSGGVQSSFYGKGLVGSALGLNDNVRGGGGYGTRGRGGGRPGYGSMSLVGSSGAYSKGIKEEAVVDGGLDPDEINAVIQRHIGQVRFCYEQGLQGLPALSGRVAVRFVIANTGFVNMASVANTSLKNSPVESCIVQRLKTWKFPEPRGGVNVRVTYPFVLKRVSQG